MADGIFQLFLAKVKKLDKSSMYVLSDFRQLIIFGRLFGLRKQTLLTSNHEVGDKVQGI
jgi:hypothetical protein